MLFALEAMWTTLTYSFFASSTSIFSLYILYLFFESYWLIRLVGEWIRAMAASSSRGRSSSPFSYKKPSSPYSSASSSSSFMNGRLIPRSCSSSGTSFYGSGNGTGSRSMTPSRTKSDSAYSRGYGGRTPVGFPPEEEMIGEAVDMSRSGDSISVTIRFRPLR